MKSLLLLFLASFSGAVVVKGGNPSNLGASSTPTFATVTASTITVTSQLSGSVWYSTTSGQLSQDNANFFYKPNGSGGPKLGIGTSSPATLLHMSSGTLKIDGNVAPSIVTVSSVGVGNVTPGFPLDVIGKSLFTVLTTTQAVFRGYSSIENRASSDSGSIQLGSVDSDAAIMDYSAAGSGTFHLRNNVSAGKIAFDVGLSSFMAISQTLVSIGTMTVSDVTAPPNEQALCLHLGQMGHCTGLVGAGGGCTCVAP